MKLAYQVHLPGRATRPQNLPLCCASWRSVERLEFVRLDGRLVLVQVRKWVLCAVVVRIIVSIDCLRLETRDRVELLDRGCAKAGEGPEHGTFDLGDLGILHGIDQGVLCL